MLSLTGHLLVVFSTLCHPEPVEGLSLNTPYSLSIKPFRSNLAPLYAAVASSFEKAKGSKALSLGLRFFCRTMPLHKK